MKTQLIFLITMCCFVCSIQAQKPFAELGLDNEVEVITLSNGRYIEYVENDTLRQIGSVMFNMNTNKVEYFIPEDDLEKVRIANREREVSRFMAVDPLSDEYPWNSPYAFSENIVISHIELEGLESMSTFYKYLISPMVSSVVDAKAIEALLTVSERVYPEVGKISKTEKENQFENNASKTSAILLYEFASGTGEDDRTFVKGQHAFADDFATEVMEV